MDVGVSTCVVSLLIDEICMPRNNLTWCMTDFMRLRLGCINILNKKYLNSKCADTFTLCGRIYCNYYCAIRIMAWEIYTGNSPVRPSTTWVQPYLKSVA